MQRKYVFAQESFDLQGIYSAILIKGTHLFLIQGYHTLVPGINSMFLEMVQVPLNAITSFNGRLTDQRRPSLSDLRTHLTLVKIVIVCVTSFLCRSSVGQVKVNTGFFCTRW